MIAYLIASAVALSFVVVYVWQDGWNDGMGAGCDARFYTGAIKPPLHPFNRRFCGWHPKALIAANWLGFVFLVASMGDWKKALLVASLPGMWIMCTFATVDGPAIALAWGAAMLMKSGHPWLAVPVAILGGFVHERSPVFAAIYAWHPLLLVGLIGVQWWKKSSNGNPSFMMHARHWRTHGDLLDWNTWVWPLRGVVPIAVLGGPVGPVSWVALGVSALTRTMGNDISRFFIWAALPFVNDMPSPPLWLVLVHVATFRRYWR